MNENSRHLWLALSVLGDWFSRLGGAARYEGMREAEIPLYIACSLAQRVNLPFKIEDYVIPPFVEAAAPVLGETHKHLDALVITDENAWETLADFMSYADSKLRAQDKCERWLRLVAQAI